MRFNVDRICELAGLGSERGHLISEGAPVPAPAKPAAPAAKPAAKTPAAKPAAPAMEEDDYADISADEVDTPGVDLAEMSFDDEAMYEIDETALMEALVDMRQARLEEETVRDAVREEITRALADKSGSWVYGSNRPTASRQGQIARGGFGVGFGFKR